MKTIQWFPGHMSKAMRMMEDNVKLCDGIVYVLDARAPIATFNNKLRQIFKDKKVLYVLNKGDLADINKCQDFVKLIESKGGLACICTATGQSSKRLLLNKIDILVAEKKARDLKRGLSRPFRLMVVGIPNTGKSSIINMLSGEKRAQTGDKAGVTRGKQWVKCYDFELLDTPGTMPPSFSDQSLAKHLAYIGCVNDDILDMEELSLELLKELAEIDFNSLKARYDIEEKSEPLEMFEQVCKRRGFILRGNNFDYERGAKALIDDLRKAKIDRITFEKAQDFKDYNF